MSHAPAVASQEARDARPAGSALTAPTSLDLRVVLFTVDGGSLSVALIDSDEGPRLPRGVPLPPEALDREARRIVNAETGLREGYLEQLYTLGAEVADRWSVVVAYLGLSHAAGSAPSMRGGRWWDVGALPALSPVDQMMIDYALVRLRAKLGYTTIAFHLLPSTFTLRELQQAYEAVLGRSLDKRNFRRRVLAAGFLEETGEHRRDGSHRPAQVYRFRAVHDPETYLTPAWAQDA